MAGFCVATLLFTVPRDLFVPHVRDVEVWAGFELRGLWARLTAPLHWALFAAGAWAFWRERPWVFPAASVYALYIAASHLLWSGLSSDGYGWGAGVAMAALFSLPAWLLWRARPASI